MAGLGPKPSSSSKFRKLARKSRVKSFQDIVLHIVDQLQDRDVAMWLYLREDDVPPRHQENFKTDFLKFFVHMKQLDIYTDTKENHGTLLDDLERLQHINLMKDVQIMISHLHAEPLQASATPKAAEVSTESPGSSLSRSDQDSQRELLNVHPASQLSNQSNRGPMVKWPMHDRSGRVQSDPDVSLKQEQCIQHPVDEPSIEARSPPPPFTSGQVGSGHVGSFQSDVSPQQKTGLHRPFNDQSIESRAPNPASIDGNASRSSHISKPLNVPPSSTILSAQTSGQIHQRPDIPDPSDFPNLTSYMSEPGSLKSTLPVAPQEGQPQVLNVHPASQKSCLSNPMVEQPLNVQPSSTKVSEQASCQPQQSRGERHPSNDQLMNPRASNPTGLQDDEKMTSQLLNAQTSSTNVSEQASGHMQQSLGERHSSNDQLMNPRASNPTGFQNDEKMTGCSPTSQLLNAQPSSTNESEHTSGQMQQIPGERHLSGDPSIGSTPAGIQDNTGMIWLQSDMPPPQDGQPHPPGLNVAFSQLTIGTGSEATMEDHLPSDLSIASSLRSTDPVPREGQSQVMNVSPSSQQPNQSLRKRPMVGPSGNVQSDPGVPPNQKPCIKHPEDEPSTEATCRPSMPSSSKVGSGHDRAGHSANYVTPQQSQSMKHPEDEHSVGPSVSLTSSQGKDGITSLRSLISQPLVQPISTIESTHTSGEVSQRPGVPHPSDDRSKDSSASNPTGNQDEEEMIWIRPSTSQPMNVQQVSAQSSTPPGDPRQAWPPKSALSSQSTTEVPQQHSKTHPPISFSTTSITSTASGQRVTGLQSGIEYGTETGESLHTLSSTETEYSQQSKSANVHVHVHVGQFQEELRIRQETSKMSVEEVEEFFSSKDSIKDGNSMHRDSWDDVDNITDDFSTVVLEDKPEPVNKEKREEEKEKDDEDEKEKNEKEMESEDEIEEVQNIPEASASNFLDEVNVYREEKKEELPAPDTGTFKASEGSWPALAVAQKLSEDKAKKEEEEAKIEYDPTTGIEKALYQKMVEHPETLSPEEHEQIKKQMMQHLQNKANPMKKNEPELPFDPMGRLSEYQKELGLPGLMGFNYIICAPSRTGKVLTAATVCDHQRKVGVMKENKKPFKFLFVTPEDRVKERHRRAFEEVFPQGSVVALDSTSKFREVFDQDSVSVVMLTGARLSVALNDGDLKFVEVHTMVVDQCHLVATDDPGIGDVIKHYLLEKKLILARKAPKGAWTLGKPYGGISSVIGLSPHLGAGTRQFSKDNIVQQCGLLDSKGIRRVETVENLRDLLDTNKPPQMDTMLLSSPSTSSVKGTFRSVVEKIMCEIEDKFSLLPETPEEGEMKKLLHPPYGTDDYTAWITPLFNEAKLCKDEGKYAPAMFLVKLNEVLMVNEDLRPKEAMAHLKEVQNLKTDQDYKGPSGNTCSKTVNEQIPELKRLAQTDHPGLTPKLTCLAQKLAKIYEDDENALGLVICRCPAVAKYLTKIISESNITMSKGILPKHLEALGRCEDDGEESQKLAQQRGILDEFEPDGSVNLVISTDFEQVDLELPDCHFVIRYNVACDEIGTIHWSGRMKARKDLCILITESGTMITDQEEKKREALKVLEKHLKVLNEMDPKNWYDIVENKQLACLRNNAHRDFMVNFQRFCRRGADYTLLCRNCRKFICNAHFLLKRGTHVSCQDSSIKERFSVASLTSAIRGSEDDTTGVLKCTGQKDGQPCQNKLGLAIDFKRQEIEEGYGLDAKGFFFSFLEGQHADYVGRDFDSWDDVDFFIYSEERSDRRGRGGGGGGDDDDDGMDDDNRGGGSGDGDDSKKKTESGASGGGEGRTQTTEGAGREETQMETQTAVESRRRRPTQDKNVDR